MCGWIYADARKSHVSLHTLAARAGLSLPFARPFASPPTFSGEFLKLPAFSFFEKHFKLFRQLADIGLKTGGKMILNGPNGISGITKISTFTTGFILIMVCLVVIFNLVNSRSGRAIMALRDNRIAAESVGINVTKYKLMAFVISAAMAGAAGALYALGQNTVTANKFDFNTSILILVYVVLGGLGNMLGSIVAATVLYLLPETVLRQFSDYRMLIYAVVLIIIMLVTNNARLKSLFSRAVEPITRLFGRGRKDSGGKAEKEGR